MCLYHQQAAYQYSSQAHMRQVHTLLSLSERQCNLDLAGAARIAPLVQRL